MPDARLLRKSHSLTIHTQSLFMTEKDQQSTSPHEQTQSSHFHTEDEIDLMDFLEVIVKKKVLILAITSICTLLSIFYAQSITPTYSIHICYRSTKKE